jgi:glycosyltransferase involved in cell wall biosynthesis
MRYAIDINPCLVKEARGPAQYARFLLSAMMYEPLFPDEEVVLYAARGGWPLGENLPTGWSRETLRWPVGRLWTQARLSLRMFLHPPDVLFVPAHTLPLLHPHRAEKRRASVVTVHDLGFRRFPHLYPASARRYLTATTAFAVRHAAKILAPSVFTKQELRALYRVDEDRVVVTPLAPTLAPPLPEARALSLRRARRLSSPFFLSVGEQEKKKNPLGMLRAFERFKARRGAGDPFELVLCGRPGFGSAELRDHLRRSPARAFIRSLGYVPSEELPAIYTAASGFLSASWYEGFGLSLLDALSSGVPLLSSDISAAREVAGDAAWYFAPDDVQGLSALMKRLAEEKGLALDLSHKGRLRAAQFSWKRTAQQTWCALREAVGSPHPPFQHPGAGC